MLVKVEGVSKKFCRSLKKSLWYGVCDIGAELNPFRRRVAEVAGSELRVAGEEAEVAGSELPVASENTSAEGASGLVTSHSPLVTPTADHAARDEDLREGEFYAVRDVSFELRRGECLGLIGHNGAGKTTLLKMLNGLIKPDAGSITMRGRVGALIALGAGFNPILTGRENIYINGSVLGLTKKEIDEKIDEIIDFAEIREAIDMPVQNYSSGMAVRLGFSVASSLSPDVLILDEILAVGDIGFVIKCLNRVRQLSAKAAVIFVSHNMQFVSSFCSRVIFMDHGIVELDAREPKLAIDRYFSLVQHDTNTAGLGTVTVDKVSILGKDPHGNTSYDTLWQGFKAAIELEFTVSEENEAARISVSIDDISNAQVITFPLMDKNSQPMEFGKGRYALNFSLGTVDLNSGKYSVLISASGAITRNSLARSQGNAPFRVIAENNAWAKIVRPIVPDFTNPSAI